MAEPTDFGKETIAPRKARALDVLKALRGAVVLLGFDPPPVGDPAAVDGDAIGLGA